MEALDNTTENYCRFLKEYCEKLDQDDDNDANSPIRTIIRKLSKEELEGEILQIAQARLALRRCPSMLSACLARACANELLSQDLIKYQLAEEHEVEPEMEQFRANAYDSCRLKAGVNCEIRRLCERSLEEQNNFPVPSTSCEVSVCAIKNTRRKMEDRHVTIPYLNQLFDLKDSEPAAFYAVYDGHGGTEAADFAKAHMHCNIVHYPSFGEAPLEALKHGFRKTDAQFIEKAKSERLRSGSTGVCALIRSGLLHVAWLGDSQALLVRDGRAVRVMLPHKPEREDEKLRIEELGGCVVWFGAWRVNGSLSVSRAIGDCDHKPFISGEPDVTSVELDDSEDYLVLACDGLWDMVGHDLVVKSVYEYYQHNNGDKKGVAQRLVQLAKERGSNDNITVLVIFLRDVIAKPNFDEVPDDEGEDGLTDGQQDSDVSEPNNSDNSARNTSPKTDGSFCSDSNTRPPPSDDVTTVQGFKLPRFSKKLGRRFHKRRLYTRTHRLPRQKSFCGK